MTTPSPAPLSTSRGLLWFDRLLRLMTVVFIVGTIAYLGTVVTGSSGGVGVEATVEPPLVISLDDGPSIPLAADGQIDDRALDLEHGEVRASIRLSENDTDARAVVALSGVAVMVALWTGLVVARRIVRAAREGNPFDPRNVRRLRVLAGLFVLVPAGSEVSSRLLSSAVDADPRLQVSVGSPDWGVLVLVGLGLLALAEVFSEGVALRDLDQATI